jgi:hypothetical protein
MPRRNAGLRRGVAPCADGTQTCVAGAGGVGSSWGACGAQVLPGPEVCDGADSNCDGRVDEGCACRAGAMQPCYEGAAGTAGVGLCRAGSQGCVLGAGGVGSAWVACAGQTLPAGEVCNTLDDNCNGAVDDGVSCSGPSGTCPAPVTAPAGTTVQLTANPANGATYRWEVVAAPPGGAYTLGSPTTPSTTFTSVIVGAFGLRFTVTDAMGRTATCTTTVTMQGHGLRVELIWAGGDSANRVDMDLQVHNRLAASWSVTSNNVNVCYWNNRNPEWDAAGPTDNPALDVDNLVGLGPENVRVDAPPTTQVYSVGVARVQLTSPATCTVTTVNDVITGAAAQVGSP